MIGWIIFGEWLSMMVSWYPPIMTRTSEMIGWFNAGVLITLLIFKKSLEAKE